MRKAVLKFSIINL